jgi:hypothetical protein
MQRRERFLVVIAIPFLCSVLLHRDRQHALAGLPRRSSGDCGWVGCVAGPQWSACYQACHHCTGRYEFLSRPLAVRCLRRAVAGQDLRQGKAAGMHVMGAALVGRLGTRMSQRLSSGWRRNGGGQPQAVCLPRLKRWLQIESPSARVLERVKPNPQTSLAAKSRKQ